MQYFEISEGKGKKVKKPFTGSVKKYLPPTSPTANDAYWHIVWEDGDECDYEKPELEKAREQWLAHSKSNKTSKK